MQDMSLKHHFQAGSQIATRQAPLGLQCNNNLPQALQMREDAAPACRSCLTTPFRVIGQVTTSFDKYYHLFKSRFSIVSSLWICCPEERA